MTSKNLIKKLSIATLMLTPLFVFPATAGTSQFSGVPLDAIVMRAGSVASKISQLKSVPSVGVINLRRSAAPRLLSDTETTQDFRLLIEKNDSGVRRLRVALKSNLVVKRALKSRGVNINRVVAAEVSSNGSIRVYLF